MNDGGESLHAEALSGKEVKQRNMRGEVIKAGKIISGKCSLLEYKTRNAATNGKKKDLKTSHGHYNINILTVQEIKEEKN